MTVHLVGAGPGDVELLTLKAARLLGAADAVVFDRLVDPEILDLVPARAERYDVGKTPGQPGPSQDDINGLLVALGHRLDAVVRLKGGDPFVFGRGVEEADACREAGVSTEVVPGITSAIAGPAAAGISVTERNVSSGCCIVTAHQDPRSDATNWAALAATGLTIIVLMGARRASLISEALIAAGRDRSTPSAVITNAYRPEETVWSGALAELGRQPVATPSILVIGSVAARATASGEFDPRVLDELRDRHLASR